MKPKKLKKEKCFLASLIKHQVLVTSMVFRKTGWNNESSALMGNFKIEVKPKRYGCYSLDDFFNTFGLVNWIISKTCIESTDKSMLDLILTTKFFW